MKQVKTRQRLRYFYLFFSFILFPITLHYLSPYLSMNAAVFGIISGSVFVFAGQFVSALFFGRIFCSWICPGGGMQEASFKINSKAIKNKKLGWIKWFIWLPWFGFLIFFLVRSAGIIKIDPFYMTLYGISVSQPGNYIIYYGIILIFGALAWLVGKRAFCHIICWMAPFMILARKLRNFIHLPALQLKCDTNKCIQCGICSQNCPMSLNVMEMVQNSTMEKTECILCGECVDHCPKHVIRFSFGLPLKTKPGIDKQ